MIVNKTLTNGEDDVDFLLGSIPVQTNQNDSVHNPDPLGNIYGVSQLHQNYMHQTLVSHQPIQADKKIFSDIMKFKKFEEIVLEDYDGLRLVSITIPEDASRFEYKVESLLTYKESLDVSSNCGWLDNRLDIEPLLSDRNTSFDQLIDQLRVSLINVANGLMIYYHVKSEFIFQIARLESYNLLLLLKDPKMSIMIANLQDGFSQHLFKIIQDEKMLLNDGHSLDISIPLLVENIINNYVAIEPKKPSMKMRCRNIPKVVYYSFFMPSYVVMPDGRINTVLDKKIISLQRKFFCKVVLEGPILKSVYGNQNEEYYRFEILFDYQMNYWILVKNELLKWFDGFVRSSAKCYIDKVCVSFAAKDFFCCDEIQNLMKRQHLLREIDPNFAKLIKWARLHQVEKSVL